jgi:hypothetical protein
VNGREPEVTGAQGLRSLAAVCGLLESQRLGRMVTLDEMLQPDAAQTTMEGTP